MEKSSIEFYSHHVSHTAAAPRAKNVMQKILIKFQRQKYSFRAHSIINQ